MPGDLGAVAPPSSNSVEGARGAISEQDRHDLHGRLDDVLGTKEATILMEHLPPGGWREIATKTDLAVLRSEIRGVEERLGLRLDKVDARIDGVEERFALRLEASQDRIRAELYQGLAGIQREMRVQGYSLLGGVSVVIVVVTAVGRFL